MKLDYNCKHLEECYKVDNYFNLIQKSKQLNHLRLNNNNNIYQKKSENANAKKLMVMIKNAYGQLNKLETRKFKTTRF